MTNTFVITETETVPATAHSVSVADQSVKYLTATIGEVLKDIMVEGRSLPAAILTEKVEFLRKRLKADDIANIESYSFEYSKGDFSSVLSFIETCVGGKRVSMNKNLVDAAVAARILLLTNAGLGKSPYLWEAAYFAHESLRDVRGKNKRNFNTWARLDAALDDTYSIFY